MGDSWAESIQADQEEFENEPLWKANGICKHVGSTYYPWKCRFCYQLKQFGWLTDAEPHFRTERHTNRIWEVYGNQPPVVPQWSSRHAVGRVRTPIIGGTPSPPDPSGGPPSASVPQDLPSTTPAGDGSYTVILRNATFNDVLIASAVLTVTLPNGTEPPPFANPEIVGARIYGEFLLDRSSTARGPSPSLLPSRMGAGDPAERLRVPSAVEDSSSLCRSVAQSEPASATFDTSAQASSWRPTNGFLLPGMHVVFAKAPPPWTAFAKPPPPMPAAGVPTPAPRGAPADPWWHSAASVRADAWRGHCQREGEEGPELSKR